MPHPAAPIRNRLPDRIPSRLPPRPPPPQLSPGRRPDPRRASPRTHAARPGASAGLPSGLRVISAVSAEVSSDGAGGEFALARTRTLRWIENHLGPLPKHFAENLETAPGCSEVEVQTARHRGAGGVVRTVERPAPSVRNGKAERPSAAPSGRYFGTSLEIGGASGFPSWQVTTILFQAGGATHLRVNLRTPRRSVREWEQRVWVPDIVRELMNSPGLIDYGWRLPESPWIIHDEESVEGLIHLISDRDRTRPVIATGLEGGETNPEDAPLDPWDLAHRTAGIAHVVVLSGPMTFVLSDRVGRRFSVFGNAVRTYRPGCVIGNRSDDHPVALPETVRNWSGIGPHEFAAFLTREAARTSVARQAAGASWLPDAVEAASLRAGSGAAPNKTASNGKDDPIGAALARPSEDGDEVHPVGAGEDAEPEKEPVVESENEPVVEPEEESGAEPAEARSVAHAG